MALIATDQLGNQFSIVISDVDGSLITTPVQNLSPSTADNSITVSAMGLITSALRLAGVLASGETPELSDANDSLMVLDQMIDAWNADRLAIYTTRADDYALVGGKQNYTLGNGGDFNSNRPARIDSMSVILLANPANSIEVPIPIYSVDDWQNKVPVKNVPGSFPLLCYDDGGFPLRMLSVWPVPTDSINHLRIYSWQSLGVPSTLQTGLSFPPGYAEAFRYNLAVRLSAEFDTPPKPTVVSYAVESLARVRSMNAPDLGLQSDLLPSPAGYNWKAEMFGIPY
jgi:hypothetical protein